MKIIKPLKKIFLFWLLCFVGATSTQTLMAQVDGQVTLHFPEEETIMTNAKEIVKAYEMGNWELLREKVTPEAMFYNLGSFDSLTVEQTVNYWRKGRETATPVLAEDGVWLAVAVPEGPREGNWILHWGNNTLTYPNGETISFPYHVALKFEGDKVNKVHFYYDNDRIIRAMGYEPGLPFKENHEEVSPNEDGMN